MWAHIPDPQRYPRLYAVVTSQMIHEWSSQRCLNPKGKCAKCFPKAFCPETVMDENKYPLYARPQDGFTYTVQQHNNAQGQQTFTNQHVIPYNPHLSMLLGCHVNVEFCANSLEVSSTSTSTSPRVQTMQPSLSLQMVLQMKFTIIRIVTILVLLKQCGISFELPSMVALQLSIVFSHTSRGRTKCTLIQTRNFHMLYSRLQTGDPCWMDSIL